VLFLVLPISAGLVVFAAPVIRLVFQRGEFGPEATATVAAGLSAYAVGLVPMAGYYVVTRSFYALQNMRTPVVIGAWMVALNAALAYALMSALGVPGIALATAIVAFVNVALLILALRQTLGRLDGARIARTAARAAVATILAVTAGWWVFRAGPWHAATDLAGQVLALGTTVCAAGVVYLAACAVLRLEEVRLLSDLLRRRGIR
jgi:putative peptidoglycan lipid II flippase